MVKKHDRRKPLDYERKTEEGVFDTKTIGVLRKLMKLGVIDDLKGVIATGKEADVFTGYLKGQPRAVKIYRIETTGFKDVAPYIQGDPRFRLSNNKRDNVFEWVKKEFRNLQRAHHAGVKVPKPYKVLKNVLVMEFIGNDSAPAVPLNKIPTANIKNPQKLADTLLVYLKDLYQKAELVHADFSEFNILMVKMNEPCLIDFAQSVLTTQPNAQIFLEKDIEHFVKYFGKFTRPEGGGLKLDAAKILAQIKGK